jgi:hypothetical protein
MKTAKARFGYAGRIVVDECPYCHKSHCHNPPVGEGQRMADCFQGEYILDFSVTPNTACTGLAPTGAQVGEGSTGASQ